MSDPINPSYYVRSIECIDAIEAALTPEEFQGYLRGTRLAYLWRAGLKTPDAATDHAKADWYLARMRATQPPEPTPTPVPPSDSRLHRAAVESEPAPAPPPEPERPSITLPVVFGGDQIPASGVYLTLDSRGSQMVNGWAGGYTAPSTMIGPIPSKRDWPKRFEREGEDA